MLCKVVLRRRLDLVTWEPAQVTTTACVALLAVEQDKAPAPLVKLVYEIQAHLLVVLITRLVRSAPMDHVMDWLGHAMVIIAYAVHQLPPPTANLQHWDHNQG
jgi:hypothetical protein